MTDQSTILPAETYLDLLRSDAARMASLAGGDGPDRTGPARSDVLGAAVPPCPGWTVRDVLIHTGNVYLHKVANMRTMAAAEFPAEDPGGDVLGWFKGTLDLLVRELETRGPDAPSYTWWEPDQTVGFWYRRMAQETAVHRVDVESAVAAVTPVERSLAVDGIDEVLTRMLAGDWSDEPQTASPESIVAVRTGEHVWRVSLAPEEVTVRTGPGSADGTVTGEPSELLLWLWGRRPDSAVQVTGEARAAASLRERLRLATQ